MLALIAFLLFAGCVALAYFRFFLGAIVAFACPPVLGLIVLLFLKDPLMDTFDDRSMIAIVFMAIVLLVEIGLFVGGLLRVI